MLLQLSRKPLLLRRHTRSLGPRAVPAWVRIYLQCARPVGLLLAAMPCALAWEPPCLRTWNNPKGAEKTNRSRRYALFVPRQGFPH